MKRTIGIILFVILNLFTSVVITIIILSLYAFAFVFTPSELIEENRRLFMIITSITVLVEGLKWVAFYFLVVKQKRVWLIYYSLYCLLLGYFAFQFIPNLIFIPFLYLPLLLFLPEPQDDADQEPLQ